MWRVTGISPHDAFATVDTNDCNDLDIEDGDYAPTLLYKILGDANRQTTQQDPKITLDSGYFAFLHPLTFDIKHFVRGHPQV